MKEHQVLKDEFILNEGDQSDSVFLILEGSVDIQKQSTLSKNWHKLAELGAGDFLGEIALLDKQPRSASAKATEDSVLYELSTNHLESLSSETRQLSDIVKVNLTEIISQRLRKTNEKALKTLESQLKEEKARSAMGVIVSWLFGGICCYVYALRMISYLSSVLETTTFVSVPILIFFTVLVLFIIKSSGYAYNMFGLTTKGWKKSVVEGVLFSIPVMILIVFGKWLYITYGDTTNTVPMFYLGFSKQSMGTLIFSTIAYSLFSPIQEFIARGGIQSAFKALLISKHKSWIAIIIANLMFSMTHLHISTGIALVVFIPGLFWGWLYNRHETLIGVCVSHLLIGLFALRIVGFPGLSS